MITLTEGRIYTLKYPVYVDPELNSEILLPAGSIITLESFVDGHILIVESLDESHTPRVITQAALLHALGEPAHR